MRMLEDMILKEGTVAPGCILKVGSFLNQQVDPTLLRAMAREVARLFANYDVNKVLTIEASGIALATAVQLEMNVPMVFAKKHKTSNVDGSVYVTTVHSFTHNLDYHVVVSSDYLSAKDRVLLVDDFCAMGSALRGLVALVRLAHAELAGAVVAVEKCFQGGGDALRAQGIRVEALAGVESMKGTSIRFRR